MGFNWDDIAAYETPRVARIKDRRLGLLWYGGVILIIGYIVGYALLYDKEYLRLQVPVGAVRLSAMSPHSNNNSYVNPTPDQLPYCYTDSHPTYGKYKNYPCLYFDEDLAVFPIGENDAISLTTRLTNYSNDLPGCSVYDSTCFYLSSPADDNYIANVESFTIMIDHSIYADEVNINVAGTSIPGSIIYTQNKTDMQLSAPDVVGKLGSPDILTVGTLLRSAGIDLDGESFTANRTFRYDGLTLLVFIKYSNTYTYNTKKIRYKYEVVAQQTKFKVQQAIYTKNQASILEWNRHGLKFIFIQTGNLGKFDFSVLLLTFVSGIGMIAICSVTVDLVATKLFPQKEIYYKYKYLETPELHDIQQRKGEYHDVESGNERTSLLSTPKI